MRDHNDNCVIVCSIENIDPMGVHTGDSRHGRAAADAHRPALPEAPRPGLPGHPRGRGGDRRLERAVRGQPGDRGDPRHRDEPARLALERAGLQGHRVPDRQDRRAAGRRLRAGGDRQRHHRGDAGRLRADDRLRRRQVAALRLREVRRRRQRADDAHEVGRRGDGDGPDVPAGVRQGDALARARRPARRSTAPTRTLLARLETARRPTATTCCSRLLRRGASVGEVHARTGIDPWFLERAARAGAPTPRRRSRGERSFKAVDTCAAEFEARTPYYYSGWERRRADEVERGDRPSVVILGSGPNRIGQGIEFDYCCVHAAMTVREAGPRRGDGQLQPGDGLDRLRHLGPPVLRAADARGRARRRRGRAARGRDRAVRRPDAAQARPRASSRPACRSSARASTRSTWPRTAGASARCSTGSGYRRRRTRPRTRSTRRSSRATRSATRCSSARPTSSAAGRWRSSTPARAWPTTCAARRRGRPAAAARSTSTASWRTRSRSTSTRCATASRSGSAGCSSTSRRRASTPATAPRCCRRTRSGPRCSPSCARQTEGIALGLGVVGLINVQYAITRRPGLRHRGQPARVADRAVHLQGGRRAAGQDGRAAHARRADRRPRPARGPDGPATTSRSRRRCCRSTASRTPTRCSAPRCARPARSWASPATSRPRSPRRRPRPARRCRSRGRSSSPSPTPTRPPSTGSPRRCTTSASGSSPRAGTAQAIRAMGVPLRGLNKIGEGSPHVVDWIERGDVDLVVNTPTGSGARSDGWEIRRAAVAARRALHHDAVERLRGRPGDRGRAAARRAEVLALQEIHGARPTLHAERRCIYRRLLKPLLFLLPAETAHRVAFRSLRLLLAAAAGPRARAAAGGAARSGPADRGARARRSRTRSAWRRASTRTAAGTASSPRSASGSSRSGRSRRCRSRATRSRACSACRATARSSTGSGSTRPGCEAARARLERRPPEGAVARRQRRPQQGDARRARGRGLRRGRAGARAVGRLRRGQRQLAEHAGAARPAGRRAAAARSSRPSAARPTGPCS